MEEEKRGENFGGETKFSQEHLWGVQLLDPLLNRWASGFWVKRGGAKDSMPHPYVASQFFQN